MRIRDVMKRKNLSVYRISAMSNIPYSTLTDIVNEKTQLEKCSVETLYKLCKALDIDMMKLIEERMMPRCSFELFKSNVCHQLKELGDKGFIINTLETDVIREYYERQWYPECLYTLAMLDYVSRINNIPICTNYNDIRCMRLQDIMYPSSIVALAALNQSRDVKKESRQKSIPEFMRFNIVECEVRNVI